MARCRSRDEPDGNGARSNRGSYLTVFGSDRLVHIYHVKVFSTFVAMVN